MTRPHTSVLGPESLGEGKFGLPIMAAAILSVLLSVNTRSVSRTEVGFQVLEEIRVVFPKSDPQLRKRALNLSLIYARRENERVLLKVLQSTLFCGRAFLVGMHALPCMSVTD